MNFHINIPDGFARRFKSREELERRALEAVAVVGFELGRFTHPDVQRLLGFGAEAEVDAFLKKRGAKKPAVSDSPQKDTS